jgi:hypothetical protein
MRGFDAISSRPQRGLYSYNSFNPSMLSAKILED